MTALVKLASDRKRQPRPTAQETPVKHKSVCLLPHATTSFSNFFQAWTTQPTVLRRQVSKLYCSVWNSSFYVSFSENFTLRKYKLKEAIAGI